MLSGSVVLERKPQALIGLVGRLDGPQPGVGEAGPIEVDDHRPAPSVLVGLKPQHLAVLVSSATTAGY
jgi:hypothetical protein